MELGTKIILTGISRHGKNRIEQHGHVWDINAVGTFRGQPAVRLQSEKKTFRLGSFGKKIHDQRWVFTNPGADEDFRIMPIGD